MSGVLSFNECLMAFVLSCQLPLGYCPVIRFDTVIAIAAAVSRQNAMFVIFVFVSAMKWPVSTAAWIARMPVSLAWWQGCKIMKARQNRVTVISVS